MSDTITMTVGERKDMIRRVEQRIYEHELTKAEQSLELMSPARVAGKLDVSLSTLGKLDIDKIDVLGNGKVIRYRASVVDAYLNDQTINA